jgi:hypothetical protein
MKKLIKEGNYILIETKMNTKVLILQHTGIFAWVNAFGIGELLVKTERKFSLQNILATGSFKLYDIIDEPNLTDLQHLELEVGKDKWQGYLLTRGLPNARERKHRIIPTYELVPTRNGRNRVYDEMIEKLEFLPNHTIKIA